MFGLTTVEQKSEPNTIKLYQVRLPLAANDIVSMDYLVREGAILVTGRNEQVILKSLSPVPVKHPIMQQISDDNALTCDISFYHSEGDVEVRACGFENGAMALYACSDIYESP